MAALEPAVQRLIRERLENLEEVEILVLLYGSKPRAWTAGEIAERLGIQPGVALRSAAALGRRGLLAETGDTPLRFRFDAADEALAADVALLVHAYDTQPVTLIRAIYDRAALTSFADAFRLRKPPEA